MHSFTQTFPRFPALVAVLLIAGAKSLAWGASVALYGANGNDTLDDTAAFLNCINANLEVDIPAGTYYISTKLSLPPNRTLRGVANNPAAAVLKLVGADDGIDVGPAANVTVQDLSLDRLNADTAARGLVFSGSSNFTIRRVQVLNHRSTAPAIVARLGNKRSDRGFGSPQLRLV